MSTYHCDACDTDVNEKDRVKHEASAAHRANAQSSGTLGFSSDRGTTGFSSDEGTEGFSSD